MGTQPNKPDSERHNIKAMRFHARDYNFVAKRIRQLFPIEDNSDRSMIERSILCMLAIDFAHEYEADNPRFDPLKFLDACSPNTDLYPLSELWEDAA